MNRDLVMFGAGVASTVVLVLLASKFVEPPRPSFAKRAMMFTVETARQLAIAFAVSRYP